MNGVDDIAMAVRDQLCIDCVCTFRDGCGCTDAIAAAIEAAILAERERCAKVADEWAFDEFELAQATQVGRGVDMSSRQIAAAIRGETA